MEIKRLVAYYSLQLDPVAKTLPGCLTAVATAAKLGKTSSGILKLPVVLMVLPVALNHLKAVPTESRQMEKRKCNTATCVRQHLANFLHHSSDSLESVLPATNVGSNTYGKRNTAEVLNRAPLNYPFRGLWKSWWHNG
ncbi:LOW QUALITY PROTEIN: islet amyloid polypeptide [Loxodonta africana]|uniref:LOW QUALITY PROTEIN: islet amyloid polypeptide n=1 Tax=Loxodonta africana TaxID=9785 RepID=UPI000C813C49|nr:LOW QUALITY PROTEIN: islet amyloid polypeptide [Loxodonta africana]